MIRAIVITLLGPCRHEQTASGRPDSDARLGHELTYIPVMLLAAAVRHSTLWKLPAPDIRARCVIRGSMLGYGCMVRGCNGLGCCGMRLGEGARAHARARRRCWRSR
jgi:hypothetical protein